MKWRSSFVFLIFTTFFTDSVVFTDIKAGNVKQLHEELAIDSTMLPFLAPFTCLSFFELSFPTMYSNSVFQDIECFASFP